jgi:hypothetical protein
VANIITQVEKEHQGKAEARMVREPGRHAAQAWVVYKGQRYEVEVPVKPGEPEWVALELAFQEIVKKARAVRLTDFATGERVR